LAIITKALTRIAHTYTLICYKYSHFWVACRKKRKRKKKRRNY